MNTLRISFYANSRTPTLSSELTVDPSTVDAMRGPKVTLWVNDTRIVLTRGMFEQLMHDVYAVEKKGPNSE